MWHTLPVNRWHIPRCVLTPVLRHVTYDAIAGVDGWGSLRRSAEWGVSAGLGHITGAYTTARVTHGLMTAGRAAMINNTIDIGTGFFWETVVNRNGAGSAAFNAVAGSTFGGILGASGKGAGWMLGRLGAGADWVGHRVNWSPRWALPGGGHLQFSQSEDEIVQRGLPGIGRDRKVWPRDHGNSRSSPEDNLVYRITRRHHETGEEEIYKYGVGQQTNTIRGTAPDGGPNYKRPAEQVAHFNEMNSEWEYSWQTMVVVENRDMALRFEEAYVGQYYLDHDFNYPEGNKLPQPGHFRSTFMVNTYLFRDS